jgi:hypothetical protein
MPRPALVSLLTIALLIGLVNACSSAGPGQPATNGPTGTGGTPVTVVSSGPQPATGAAPWPAPPGPMARAMAAGLLPQRFETLQHHVHAHLDVYVDGHHETVPAGIGINISDPAVERFVIAGQPAYGGIGVPCAQACISPLHTHDVTGILHTESPTNVDHTLGQLFIEWAVRLDANCVGGYCRPAWSIATYVNGKPFTGSDPGTITLTNHKEIAIVIGAPPARIPASADFSAA